MKSQTYRENVGELKAIIGNVLCAASDAPEPTENERALADEIRWLRTRLGIGPESVHIPSWNSAIDACLTLLIGRATGLNEAEVQNEISLLKR